ncbi:MAG: terminase small subunit [Pseudomonadota bacterium]
MDDAPSLRALTADEGAAVERHPLPEGVADAEMNKGQLAHALGVSPTTVDNWRQAGLPYDGEGTNGRPYVFRLSIAYAWVAARRDAESTRRKAADESAAQMRLAIVGGETAADMVEGLSPKEQREVIDLEYSHMRAAEARGELLRSEDVAEGLTRAFAAVRDGLDALPDRLARELSLDGAGVEAAQVICDDVLQAAVREVGEMFGHGDDGGEQV